MDIFLDKHKVAYRKTFIDMKTDIVLLLKEFMKNEVRLCSMDFGCVTPLYVYKMWGGALR